MGTLYDPVESDLMSYKVNFILSPELWDKFDLEGIDVDYSKWDRAKMIGMMEVLVLKQIGYLKIVVEYMYILYSIVNYS